MYKDSDLITDNALDDSLLLTKDKSSVGTWLNVTNKQMQISTLMARLDTT